MNSRLGGHGPWYAATAAAMVCTWFAGYALAEEAVIGADVRGVHLIDPTELAAQLRAQPGKQLDPADIDADLQDIVRAYRKAGWAPPSVTSETFVPQDPSAALHIIYRVGEVRVRFEGLVRVDELLLLSLLPPSPGGVPSPGERRDILQALWDSNFFDDVRLATTTARDGQPAIVIGVEERPLVEQVDIEGNDSIDKEKLTPILRLKDGMYLDPGRLRDSVVAVENHYRGEGFAHAQVSYKVEDIKNRKVKVTFVVQERSKVYIRQVNLVGNRFFGTNEIVQKLQLQPKGVLSFLSQQGVWNRAQIDADVSRIRAMYYSKGFLKVQVDTPVVTLSDDGQWVTIDISLQEGDQYRLRSVKYEGDLLFSEAHLREQFGVEGGEPLDRLELEQSIMRISDSYSDLGFAFARVDPQFDFHEAEKEASVIYTIKRNQLVYIRFIEVAGNSRTRDKIIRRELTIEEGQLFSGSGLRLSRERVFALGYFEDVSFETQAVGEDRMDLTIRVSEKSTGTATAGVGFSSVDQFVGMLKLNFGNLLGYGLRLNLAAEYGARRQTLAVDFTDPYFLDTKFSLNAGFDRTQSEFFVGSEELQQFTEIRTSTNLTFGYLLARYTRAFLGYQFQVVDNQNLQGADPFLQGGTTRSVVATFRRDSKNHPYDPSSGSDNLVSSEYAGGPLGGDYTFVKYSARSQWFYNPWWKFVLMLRGDLGFAVSPEQQRIPFSERYFLGGALFNLRGYDFRSVGPTQVVLSDPSSIDSPTTTLIAGGNKQAFFNFEVLFPIIEAAGIKGVAFLDGGNAWQERELFFATALRLGYGVGVRWFSPIGPLRFEWGFPLDRRPQDRSSVFEFNIGTYF